MLERSFECKERQVEIVIDGDEAKSNWGWSLKIDGNKFTPGDVRISRGATGSLAYAKARTMREIDTMER
jgi:hypothetical protein